ncbi:MAG TPA: SLBB domain-containing protein, partial [Steroidobacteraceae bacterium]|nr:SLBB domain-containing protein [Steroidobacteraceae bacterium]
VTVTGHGVRAPANVEARIGTTFAELVDVCGGYGDDVERLIMGGSMMGIALPHDDLPVVKGTNCIIAAGARDLRPRGPEMPCIRCGECSTACPVSLLPQQLHWHARDRDLDALVRFGLDDCIECGCCDYVCPSQIALTTRFRSAKGLLRQRDDTRARAERARERFEARARRLDAQAAERAQRLEAKRRAAGRQPAADDSSADEP